MQQSNVIFGALFIAYLVFITVRGELGTYLDILRGNTTSQSSNASGSNSLASGVASLENSANALTGNTSSTGVNTSLGNTTLGSLDNSLGFDGTNNLSDFTLNAGY